MTRPPTKNLCLLAACCLTLATPAPAGQSAADFVPARRLSGSLPPTPGPRVVGWIEERLEVLVDAASGRVAKMTKLRASPLPNDLLAPAVAGWQFRPASDRGRPAPSHVLIAAIFRPPQLLDAPTLGEPPVTLATPSDDVPFPAVTEPPRYPPLAVGDGVVLVEVLVGLDGRVRAASVIDGPRGFAQASLDAARRWSFRPARWNGSAIEAYAYLVFGFRQPVVGGKRPVAGADR